MATRRQGIARVRSRLLTVLCVSVLCAAAGAVGLSSISAQVASEWAFDDDPAIEVWFEEGCDRTYAIGDHLHLRYRANVDGMARVWRFPDEELFTQEWMAANVVYEIEGPVTGPPGEWWILGELLESGATDTCYYTTTVGAATPTGGATSAPTATASSTITATATEPATATADATEPATATANVSATAPATTATTAVTATRTATRAVTPTAGATATTTSSPAPTASATPSEPAGAGSRLWLPTLLRGAANR